MGTITYNITSGQEPFTAVLTPPIGSPYIETGLSLGVNTFEGIPEGSNYTLTVADSRGCTWVIEDIDFFYIACSDTDVFQYAHSSIVVNDVMFLGERKSSPYVVRFPNPDDLSVYTRQAIPGVGSAGQGLESVCYSSSTEKLYFGARDSATGYLAIVEVDPDDVSVYTVHVITSPSPIIADLFVITTDGTYIYGGTDEVFFKIRISDWEVVQTTNFIASGFTDSHGAAISIDRGLFYVSSQYGVSKLAIVSMTDISSYTIVDLSAHVSHPTDDICVYDDGDVCKVYVAGEWSYVGNGAASVEITNGNLVEGIELLPSYGLWEHCGIIYSAAISNRIQWFDVDNPSVKAEAYIESGYIPNEILIINNRLFATKWAALGSAKLCELFCVNVVCNTTTTTSSTSSTTTTTTTIEETTTTTTSTSSTTTTTTTCYQLVGCGIYDIDNPTNEFRQISWKYCGEESWRGIITLPPYTTYTNYDCRAFEAYDCDITFALYEECLPSTTTTTTTQDCSMEGYIVCDYCDCEDDEILVSDDETYGVANTYGTYCGLSDEKYNSQMFTLLQDAYVKRVGVLGWNKVGSPDVTIQGLLLTKKSPDYAGRPGCTTVTAAPYPGFDVELSINTIRFTGTPPATPEWYYFCFDNVYLEAGQWAFAMIFTDQTTNDGSNYVQFCTGGDDYAGGNYAYKISPEISDPYGIPEVLIDLSCKICYEEATTTTTSTTQCTMPSGWTEQGTLISNGDFGGNFNVDFTSNLDDACESLINFNCNGGSLYGGDSITGKWWGPHDNFRVGDDIYYTNNCTEVIDGYYILNSTDHYYEVIQVDNGSITTYWDCGECPTTTTTTTIGEMSLIFSFDVVNSQSVEVLFESEVGQSIRIEWGDTTTHTFTGTYTTTKDYGSSGNRTVDLYAYNETDLIRIELQGYGGDEQVSFDLSGVPSAVIILQVFGWCDVTGALSDLPSTLTQLTITGGTITGTLTDLPNTLISLDIESNSGNITGNISDLPSSMEDFTIKSGTSVSGNLSSLPSTLISLWIDGNNTITGDLSSLPSEVVSVVLGGDNTVSNYTGGRSWAADMTRVTIDQAASYGFSSNEVDNLLIDLADTTWPSGGDIELLPPNDCRTSASDTAYNTLDGYGVNITVNVCTTTTTTIP